MERSYSQKDIDDGKVFGILAYFGILFIIPLLAAKDNAWAKYHANQGFVLFLLELAVGIVIAILTPALILSAAFALVGILSTVLWIGVLVLAIIGIVNAANGKAKPLPIIGGIELIK